MKPQGFVPLTLALAFALPALAPAQGLGDMAARERAKREKETSRAAPAPPSFSNEDLERGRPPAPKGKKGSETSGSAASTPSAAPPSESGSPVAQEPERAQPKPEEPRPAPSQVAALEARVKELQDKLNPMSGSFIYGATGSNDPSEEARVRSELQQLEAQLAAARSTPAQSSPPKPSTEDPGLRPD